MKVTVIGQWGAYPAINEATSGYLVQTDEINLLMDCGSGVLSKVQSVINLADLDSVILSHYHADHSADIYCLQYAMMILRGLGQREKPLNIYGYSEDPKFATLTYQQHCLAHSVEPGQVLQLGDVKITFAQTVHPVYSLAIRIEQGDQTLVYTGDTGWSEAVVQLAKGADLLISECTLYNSQRGKILGHLTAGEAGKLAHDAGVKHLILSHLPHYGDHQQLLEEARAEFPGSVQIAFAGLSWEG